jgi:hypothetical protein
LRFPRIVMIRFALLQHLLQLLRALMAIDAPARPPPVARQPLLALTDVLGPHDAGQFRQAQRRHLRVDQGLPIEHPLDLPRRRSC